MRRSHRPQAILLLVLGLAALPSLIGPAGSFAGGAAGGSHVSAMLGSGLDGPATAAPSAVRAFPYGAGDASYDVRGSGKWKCYLCVGAGAALGRGTNIWLLLRKCFEEDGACDL